MKNYSDLPDTDTTLSIILKLEPVGNPMVRFGVNENIIDYQLAEPLLLEYEVNLMDPFNITVELYNKVYTIEYETAVIIQQISVDNINIIPRYDYLAEYTNDHGNHNPTSYLGFNGKWVLTFDRPFYQWLHQAQNQGWLIG
jgi:hypothetical protein